MSKKISSFRSLCQRDQIALLKGGCTELMILRSVTTYDAENNSWNVSGGVKGVGAWEDRELSQRVLGNVKIDVFLISR